MEEYLDLNFWTALLEDDGKWVAHARTVYAGAVIDRERFEAGTWFDLMAQLRAWHIERSRSWFQGCWPDKFDDESVKYYQHRINFGDEPEQY